jgi:hypothetical protein
MTPNDFRIRSVQRRKLASFSAQTSFSLSIVVCIDPNTGSATHPKALLNFSRKIVAGLWREKGQRVKITLGGISVKVV